MVESNENSANITTASLTAPEPFVTMKHVAAAIGIPYYKIVRAVNAGLVPHHTLFDGKKYLRLSEVLASIECHEEKES